MKKCKTCGRGWFPLVIRINVGKVLWCFLALTLVTAVGFGINAISESNHQKKLRTQFLLSEMAPAWQTMYYVLQKVGVMDRTNVMTEFIDRSPQFFEGQALDPEQIDLLLDLFRPADVPRILLRINPNHIKNSR